VQDSPLRSRSNASKLVSTLSGRVMDPSPQVRGGASSARPAAAPARTPGRCTTLHQRAPPAPGAPQHFRARTELRR
jgi:hypothetical protein